MSFVSKISIQTYDTSDRRWREYVVQELLEYQPVIVTDGQRRCFIPGGRISGPVWKHAVAHLRAAGIKVPRWSPQSRERTSPNDEHGRQK